ncbi:MAG: phosphotransferase [Propionicimonas sp.]|uniref:phosphotransferase n=1 Tax=Propionicimonas sp. TaxID=1955623 RepID=UPI003D0FE8F0
MSSDNPNTRLDGVVVPGVVRDLAAGRRVSPVWRNEIGGVTFSVGDGAEYVKYGPPHAEFDPVAESERLGWVGAFVTAPCPLGHGRDAAGNLWFRTAGIPATSAVLGGWRSHPERVVPELGRALRRFHEVVPVDSCRWEWSVAGRLAYRGLPADHLGAWPDLDPVVCHGDACNPNFLLDADGRCVGYVDLGRLGVGDRWADLAPALLSLGWNFGPGWEPAFLAAYGIDPDPAKQDFYTRLWNAE